MLLQSLGRFRVSILSLSLLSLCAYNSRYPIRGNRYKLIAATNLQSYFIMYKLTYPYHAFVMSKHYKRIKKIQDDLTFVFVLSGLCVDLLHFKWLQPISLAVGMIVYSSAFYLIYAHWKKTKSIKAALKDNIYSTCLILWICFVTCLILIRIYG